jgi:hypothetical protein
MPLQVSPVPVGVHVSQFPSPSVSDQPGMHSYPQSPSSHRGTAFSPAVQTRPQLPQFSTSVFVSTHPEGQDVSPVGHSIVHLPPEQTSWGWHWWPHSPQFSRSVARTTQEPSHRVSPSLQTTSLMPSTMKSNGKSA